MSKPAGAGKRQRARPGRAPAMILMQVREYDGRQVGRRRSGRREPVAEPPHERLDARSVAEEAQAEAGVDDGVAVGGFHKEAVVAACDRRAIAAFRRTASRSSWLGTPDA